MPGDVRAQVIMLAVTAELVVADVTEANPNVFYELGIRTATGKPTILVSRDLTKLPFDISGMRTILIDDSTEQGTKRAVREVHRYAENILATALSTGPVTDLFTTTFIARERTVLGAFKRRSEDGTRAERPSDHVGAPWRILPVDSFDEHLLAVAESPVTQQVTMLMLQRLMQDPHSGMPFVFDGEVVYLVRGKAERDLPPLILVYSLDTRERVVQPLFIFRGQDEDLDATPPRAGGAAQNEAPMEQLIKRHLNALPSRWH